MTTCIANGFSNGIVLPAKQKEFIGGMYACDGSDIPATQDFGTTTQGPSETAYSVPANTVAYTVIGKTQCGKDVRRIITTTYSSRSYTNQYKAEGGGYDGINHIGYGSTMQDAGDAWYAQVIYRSCATKEPVYQDWLERPHVYAGTIYCDIGLAYNVPCPGAIVGHGQTCSVTTGHTTYYLDTHVVYTYITP